MNRTLKFRAKATQEYQTNTDGVEVGDWVEGYYYYCRQRETGIIVTTLGAESGGVGSGLVQVEVEVDHKTVGWQIVQPEEVEETVYRAYLCEKCGHSNKL